MSNDVAISLRNVSKKYKLYDQPIDRLKEALHPFKKQYHKDFYALRDINLEVKKGEVLGIVGVNGAGKSTLLKIISNVIPATTGTVQVNGKVNAILELSSGLKPELTGIENIKLNLRINGVNAKNQKKLLEEIIAFADIGEHIHQPVKTYSSGMKARLGFGIATSTEPDILIVDEVLAVGDALFQRKCYARIEKLFNDGKTVIFVSHSAQSIIQFCSRAVLLFNRSIVMSDTPKKVTDYYQQVIFGKSYDLALKAVNRKQQTDNIEVSSKGEQSFLPKFIATPRYINPEVASFEQVKITDEENNVVNLLEMSRRYMLSGVVKFNQQLDGVRFGMQIKKVNGLLLAGTNTKDFNKKVYSVEAQAEYQLELSFENLLLPGDYTISIVATNDESMASIEDAYIFKVRHIEQKSFGVVYLNQKISVELTEN